MLIGTQTDFAVINFGLEKGIELIARAGFKSLDYSMYIHPVLEAPFTLPEDEFCKYFKSVCEAVKKNNLVVGQTHPPFPTYTGDEKNDDYLLEILNKSIRATALLDCKYAVIHPAMDKRRKYGQFAAQMKEINIKRYLALYESLEKYDVYCCIENMFSRDHILERICPTTCSTAEEMVDYIDTLNTLTNSNRYVACLDIGHANLIRYEGYDTVNPVDMIHILGDRLKVLHVQDTDGKNDLHMPPGFGNIDFDAVCKALKENGYNGVFSLESDRLCFKLGKQCAKESERLMYSIAKKLVATIGKTD